jgi:DNA-binding transcriptional MerR regulator
MTTKNDIDVIAFIKSALLRGLSVEQIYDLLMDDPVMKKAAGVLMIGDIITRKRDPANGNIVAQDADLLDHLSKRHKKHDAPEPK